MNIDGTVFFTQQLCFYFVISLFCTVLFSQSLLSKQIIVLNFIVYFLLWESPCGWPSKFVVGLFVSLKHVEGFAVDVAFGARVAGRHGVLALEVPTHAPHVPRDFAAQFALVARALDFLHVPLDEL